MSFEKFSKLDGFVFDLQRHEADATAIGIYEGANGLPNVGETTYYDVNGAVVSGDDIAAGNYAVSVTHNAGNEGPTYSVNVKAAPTAGVVINGQSVGVSETGATRWTEFTIMASGESAGKFRSISDNNNSFKVDESGVIVESETNFDVLSGTVTTSCGAKIFYINHSDEGSKVKFTAGTKLEYAGVYETDVGSVTLKETGTTTETIVGKDGAVAGLDSGQVNFSSVPTGKTLNVNGAAYVAAGSYAHFEATSATAADTYLTLGTVLVNGSGYTGSNNTVQVMAAGATTETTFTSKITTKSATATVEVKDGKYTISNLQNNDQITIDSKTYKYNSENKTLLTATGEGFVLTDDISQEGKYVTFTIKGGTTEATDEIFASTGEVIQNIQTPGVLASIAESVRTSGTTAYFAPDGSLQEGETGAGFMLEKRNTEVNLTAIGYATTITIDATGAILDDVLLPPNVALTLKINDETKITSGNLNGAGSIVQVGNGDKVQAVSKGTTYELFSAEGGVLTLTSGVYTSAKGVSISTDSRSKVVIGVSGKEITFGYSATGFYASDSDVKIETGQLTVKSGVATKKVNDVTYAASTDLVFEADGADIPQAYLISGTVTGATAIVDATPKPTAVLVKNTTDNTASSVLLQDNGDPSNDLQMSVSNGKYTISGLEDYDTVVIDGVTYSYYKGKLTNYDDITESYLVKTDGTVGFNIVAGQDTIDTDTAVVSVGSLAETALKTISEKLGDSGTVYFDATGAQQRDYDADTTAYTFEKTSDGGVTLTSNAKATTGIATINATDMKNLTVNFTEGTGLDVITVDGDTEMTGILGANDSVKTSDDAKLAKASVAGAAFKVDNTGITLTGGTYVSALGVSINTTLEDTTKITAVDIGNITNQHIVFGKDQEVATGFYASAGNVTINTGQLVVGNEVDADGDDANGNQKKVNDVTYTSNGALTFKGINGTAYLTEATSATSAGRSTFYVAKLGTTNAYSSVHFYATEGLNEKIMLKVKDGRYEISGLDTDGDAVIIDDTTYTYDSYAQTLKVDGTPKYKLKNSSGTIAFTINGGTDATSAADSIDTSTAYELVHRIKINWRYLD